jgi:AcrR family transcriptional regulator
MSEQNVASLTVRRKRQQRYDALVRYAAVVIAGKGFQTSTLREIAAGVGKRPNTILELFPTKNAMLEAVCLAGLSESVTRYTRALSGGLNVLDALCELMDASSCPPDRWRFHAVEVFVRERQHLSALSRKKLEDLARTSLRQLSNVRPEIDTHSAARAFVTFANSVVVWRGVDASLLVGRLKTRRIAQVTPRPRSTLPDYAGGNCWLLPGDNDIALT